MGRGQPHATSLSHNFTKAESAWGGVNRTLHHFLTSPGFTSLRTFSLSSLCVFSAPLKWVESAVNSHYPHPLLDHVFFIGRLLRAAHILVALSVWPPALSRNADLAFACSFCNHALSLSADWATFGIIAVSALCAIDIQGVCAATSLFRAHTVCDDCSVVL